MKDRLFRWALKRQFARLPLGDIVIIPDGIFIPIEYAAKPVVFPIQFTTPNWRAVLSLFFKEVVQCLK